MELNNLKYKKGSRDHKVKTLGRGYGSGMGKRSTRGQKGQHARKSGNVRQGFEGGQTPLYRRIPKVGFNNVNFAIETVAFTTDEISSIKDINVKTLKENKFLPKNSKALVKIILGKKPIKVALNVQVNAISAGAKKAIEAAGGKVDIIVSKEKVEKKVNKKHVAAKKAAKKVSKK